VKRHLDIEDLIPEIKPGMAGAVEYGTARRIGFDPESPILARPEPAPMNARPRTWAGSDRSLKPAAASSP
jgi:hypothetical protein